MKYLTPETVRYYHDSVRETMGLIAVAERIEDPVLRASVQEKIRIQGEQFRTQYDEIENDDGSVLVKHPGIGVITVNEVLLTEPVRLFASRVKSLSTMVIRLYRANALIGESGEVTYVDRQLALEVEMTQSAFASFVARSMGHGSPATVRHLEGHDIAFEGDVTEARTKLMFESVMDGVNKLDGRADNVIKGIEEAASLARPLSKASGEAISHEADILKSWLSSNPGYYAKLLGEFTAHTAADVKTEIFSLAKAKAKGSL